MAVTTRATRSTTKTTAIQPDSVMSTEATDPLAEECGVDEHHGRTSVGGERVTGGGGDPAGAYDAHRPASGQDDIG